ncbi:N-acetylglucosamine-6-phosphate deacetylase [Entomospira culicis]|uniref:N-acetylglucosamine-6-phosphate deacetylase n=1 Tax=Entomospira culicis TaxID=2719989 RepID=A0A968KVA0_9SPIO|nr:N-acetylglucosamine-6-phosphate deacetylase [Entomospira culicis]NIZ18673.1 N-acetylglucosamine-6-phosphate deacetylase [Entomospira culicis]NIZ68888.1 N-acetylglucosamine-6-phosphate deacetylase [Entomospira culicis]WDI37481.1 N-acetylglucosamine-6-phosphate deacetylase [Entomospira culicis]WDI39109.1 N-acetylglucosamine-6-phosphate deacetylase [Entomospira culicis]
MPTICLFNGKIYTGVAVIEAGALIIDGDHIEDVVTMDRLKKKSLPSDTLYIDLQGKSIAPGFIDTHIHGLEGFDTAHGELEDFLGISAGLPRIGVTSFCPTLYPQQEADMLKAIHFGAQAMGKESGAVIHGLHLEGPFISCNKLGVQRPETIKSVDIDFMKRMQEAGGDAIRIMTVAPELKNMRDLALHCAHTSNTILSAGHTDATYDNMMEGIQAGILHCTHMFNAMRSLHHRDPGGVGAILIHPDFSCELIADGVHVHPALVKLLLDNKPSNKIILVTDALAPTMQSGEGPFFANGEEVYMSEEGIWRRKKDGVIAGSALTLDRAVLNMTKWGTSRESALRMAATNAALLLNKEIEVGYLLPEKFADFIIFEESSMEIQATYVRGVCKYEK